MKYRLLENTESTRLPRFFQVSWTRQFLRCTGELTAHSQAPYLV